MNSKLATALVVAMGMCVMGICAWKGVSSATIAAIGAVLVPLAGAMKGLLADGDAK